jgi:hypothetical protein
MFSSNYFLTIGQSASSATVKSADQGKAEFQACVGWAEQSTEAQSRDGAGLLERFPAARNRPFSESRLLISFDKLALLRECSLLQTQHNGQGTWALYLFLRRVAWRDEIYLS